MSNYSPKNHLTAKQNLICLKAHLLNKHNYNKIKHYWVLSTGEAFNPLQQAYEIGTIII